MSIERTQTNCQHCGGPVYGIRISLPGGDRNIGGECGVCSAAIAEAAQMLDKDRRRASMVAECGLGPVDVWPGLSPFVAEALGRKSGLVLVAGDVMSGKTTLAKAWVRGCAERGQSARYQRGRDIVRARAQDYGELSAAIMGVGCVAIDGIGDNESPLETWQHDRFNEILSDRHDLLTLVTVPSEALSDGARILATRVGPTLARRVLLMSRRGGKPIVLRSQETSA